MATRLQLIILICLNIIFVLLIIPNVRAQVPTVQYPIKMDVSIPLSSMRPAQNDEAVPGEEEERSIPNKIRRYPDADPNWIDPVMQKEYNMPSSKAPLDNPIVNFSGITNGSNPARYTPPDPAGDVGPNHYVQVVNVSLQIFNKTGTSLYGPVTTSTIWSGFTGAWTGHNDGDAIVMYDENADRWVISQFAVNCGTFGSYTAYELVAVSTTADPTGSYYRYAFQFDYMPDFPKLGVWNDGYYMAINRFNTNVSPNVYIGSAACVMERSKMIAGDPTARLTYFKTETLGGSGSGIGSNCWSMLPSDCDGTMPASGTPNYFAYINPSVSNTQLRIWALQADWTIPANSTFVFQTALPIAAYAALGSVPQSGSASLLDALSDRLMFRNQYRNFGTYESFLTCHSVTTAGIGGIRWYEYRRTTGVFSIYQQGTYAPADAKHRWMGSIAMNAAGDIGLIYTASNGSSFPSIYYTGRKAVDAAGIMTMPEGTIQAGTASLSGTNGYRWGDYSALNIDPSDNLTFWGTHEYVGTYGGNYPWATKIASFKIPHTPVVTTTAATDITLGTATLNGIVNPFGQAGTYHFEWGTSISYGNTTNEVSAGSGSTGIPVNAAISGLVVGTTYHFRIVATNVDGTSNGSDLTFAPGGALLTTTAVSALTQNSASAGGNITADGGSAVTVRGVCWGTSLNPIASGNHTTDGSGTGVFTSSVTGLSANTAYHVRAYATNANGTFYGDDILFTTQCASFLLPFTEGFSASSLPPCWSQVDYQGYGQGWQFGTTSSTYFKPSFAGSYAYLNSDAYGRGNTEFADLITPTLDLTGYSSVNLAFNHYHRNFGAPETATLYYSINNGSTWVQIQQWTSNTSNPQVFSQTIPAVIGQSQVKFKWTYFATWGAGWAIDALNITGVAYVWTGAVTTDWNTTTNWSTGTVPAGTNWVIIPGGLTRYPIISTASKQCSNLLIYSGGSVTINPTGSLTVNGTLTNNAGTSGIIIKSDATGTGSLLGNSSNSATVERYLTGSATDWHLVSPPVSGQGIESFVTDAANNIAFISPKYGLAPYDNTVPAWKHYNTTVSDPYYIGSAGNLTVGKGYEILRNSNGVVTFTGTLATGSPTIPVAASSSAWNLIGNPFSSAIYANSLANATNNFITQNLSIFSPGYAAIYIWNPVSSSYTQINQATAAAYIPIGQGFFVKSVAGPVNATFPTAGRLHSTTAFTKGAETPWPSIDLQAGIDGKACNTQVYFIPGATTEIDEGYDAGIFTGENIDKAVYTHIEGSDIGFGIQSLPGESYKGCYIQIGLNARRGSEVTFSAGLFNLPTDEMVYLRDIFAGTSTCLSIPGNTYKVVLNDDNSGIGRFYLTMSQLTVGSQAIQEDLYSVVPVPRQNILRLAGHFVPGSKVSVYDISGRVIDSYSISNEGINELHFSPASSGVYMVRIQSGSVVINQKFAWVN